MGLLNQEWIRESIHIMLKALIEWPHDGHWDIACQNIYDSFVNCADDRSRSFCHPSQQALKTHHSFKSSLEQCCLLCPATSALLH